MINVEAVRILFRRQLPDPDTGMLEIVNASFIADEPAIFGTPNEDWHARELKWYLSQSLNVNDIPGEIPAIWKQVADKDGFINSNYGWCIFSNENGNQFDNAIEALTRDRNSRQAVMIYNRPSMHKDSTRDGMRDFMCTHCTHMMIRNGQLLYMVNMRSNDAVLGYKGDYAWQKWVYNKAYKLLRVVYPDLTVGPIYWNVGSLHVYPRHHHLVMPS